MVPDPETVKVLQCSLTVHYSWPKHGVPVVQMHLSIRLCFLMTLGLNLVGKQWWACLQHHKISGTWDHQNCILIGPRSWWGLEQLVFCDLNRSVTGDLQKCASLCTDLWSGPKFESEFWPHHRSRWVIYLLSATLPGCMSVFHFWTADNVQWNASHTLSYSRAELTFTSACICSRTGQPS